MAENFTKLFSSITASTVWLEDSDTRIVWVTMLAMADQDGYVGASIPGLASIARVPVEKVLAALEKFKAPDSYSRSKEHEGRRIEEVDRGWVLLNHRTFREHRNEAGPGGTPAVSTKRSRIYFIQCGDTIKIGLSQNPWARLRSLRTGFSSKPVLLGHMPGTEEDEASIHKRFEAHRITGEWYRMDQELLAFIGSFATPVGSPEVATGSYQGVATSASASVSSGSGSVSASGSDPSRAIPGGGAWTEAKTGELPHPGLWDAATWLRRHDHAWCAVYGGTSSGGGMKTAAALGELADRLAGMSAEERLAAQERSPAMFREWLADVTPIVLDARHPFAWFVTRFDGLRRDRRIPRTATGPPKRPGRGTAAEQDEKAREMYEAGRRWAAGGSDDASE